MPKIGVVNKGLTLEAPKGISILEACLEHPIDIYHTCGGNRSCGTCRVMVLRGAENLSSIESGERQILDTFDLSPSYRLACQAIVLGGDVEIKIHEWERPPRPNKTPPIGDGRQGTY